MKTLFTLLFLLAATHAWSDGEIWLPNVPGYATGTKIGNTTGLDVNVAAGTITATNPSVGSTGAAVPSSGTYAAGNKAGSLTGLLIGQSTANSSLSVVLASDQGAVPVSESGTWTVQPGNTANTSPWLMSINMGGTTALVTPGQALKVDASASTQPVSGTVAVTQSTSPWVNNITQFGGNNVVTGTGASGVGVPRFTISNDSSLAANQSVNMTQWNGNTVAAATPIPVGFSTSQVAPKTYPNSAASFVINTGLTTVAATEAAPANSVGFILEASSSNSVNLRYVVGGGTATTSSGMRLEPGRDSGFVPAAANISIIAESNTSSEYEITWVRQ